MIRHQILSVRMSTRLVLRIGCFVFGCLFRAVTMQGESLRFAFVLTWKRTQTTQTRAFRPQQRVALASPRLASCSRSRFGVAHRVYQYHSDHKAAAVCENRRLEAITRPQGVWVQPAVRRERLVAAAEGCVCAVCVLFQIRSKLNQSLPFLSPRKTNTIIREERADKKSPCSL